MRFHWGWIGRVMPVPYVPTLGPVHPDDPIPDLFEAVVETAGTGCFLPYDKDRRWSDTKTERVLVDAIEHDQRQTLVPTLVERGTGAVKVHVYGSAPDSLSTGADLARKLAAAHGAAKARVVWFLGPDQPEAYSRGVGTRVQLKDFADGPGLAPAVPVSRSTRNSPKTFALISPPSQTRWPRTASRSSTSRCKQEPSAPFSPCSMLAAWPEPSAPWRP
ncbi:hypothetical protein [Streptomyces brasiliensis]|uniref:Uncharacterized protein n=1 Tax=Streptomyces brasiliensis TaxID=1954 RepID=A0A917UIG1_9ACTN|nr:hypothetical protein [Streptomyces brasiliensis]GGJ60649.1 hypothetical protein GCM10010121_084120 [Streptomyces brasiliensis]